MCWADTKNSFQTVLVANIYNYTDCASQHHIIHQHMLHAFRIRRMFYACVNHKRWLISLDWILCRYIYMYIYIWCSTHEQSKPHDYLVGLGSDWWWLVDWMPTNVFTERGHTLVQASMMQLDDCTKAFRYTHVCSYSYVCEILWVNQFYSFVSLAFSRAKLSLQLLSYE